MWISLDRMYDLKKSVITELDISQTQSGHYITSAGKVNLYEAVLALQTGSGLKLLWN